MRSTLNKLNQRGAAHILLVLVILVVAVSGFVGWQVWRSQKKLNNTTPASNATQQPANVDTEAKEEPKKVDETESWLLYESPGKEFKVRLADGWNFERFQQSSGIYSLTNANVEPEAGVKAEVVQVEGGKDAAKGAGMGYHKKSEYSSYVRGDKQTGFKTNSGLEVEVHKFIQTKEPEGLDISKGGSQYFYEISKSDAVFLATYSIDAGEADYSETVVKSLKTVQF